MNQRKIGAILSYASIFISTGISLVYTPYMLKSLGESEHGLFSLVNSVVAYFTLMDFGFGNAIIRYSAKYIANKDKESEGKLLGMFLFIYSVIGLVILLLGMLLAFNVESIFSRTFTEHELLLTKYLIIVGIINIALSFPSRIFNASIQAHQQFLFSKFLELIRHIMNPLLMVIILLSGHRSLGLMIGVLTINISFSLIEIIYYFTRIKIKIILSFKNFGVLKEISVYSFWIFLNLIVDKINWSTNQLLLGIFTGTTAVSIYSIGATINGYYMNFSTATSGVFLPETTKMVERKAENKDFSNLFTKVGRIQFLIMGLVLSGFIIYGKPFIEFWAGSNYKTSYYIAVILIVPVTVPLMQNMGLTILQAKNIHKFRSLVYIGIAILNVVLSIPLIKYYGTIGASIGTAISLIIGNIIVMNIYYQKKVNLDIIGFWKNITKMSIGMIIPIAIALLVRTVIPITNWWVLIISIFIYSIIYSVSMWILSMNKYEKNLILTPIKRLLKYKR